MPRNIEYSIFYFTLSSKKNDSNANLNLGYIYYSDILIKREAKKARQFFIESSKLNNSQAKNYLGILSKNGEGVQKNIFDAIVYFQEAINKDNDYAKYNLARIYFFGIDIEKNIMLTIDLLEQITSQVFLRDIFLFFIYNYGGDEIKNYDKSIKYRKDIKNNYNLNLKNYYTDDQKKILFERLLDLFKNYDLGYSIDKTLDVIFLSYMKSESFLSTPFTDYLESQKLKPIEDLRQKINRDFYEGFGIPLI